MCGLAGYYVWGSAKRPDLSLATSLLRHRGPDASHTWQSAAGSVGLAHTRLSIIDLSEAANQPFHLADVHLVYNGEVYNFRELAQAGGYPLRTHSDTEVLAWAYKALGEAALPQLNGMFAFALYDDGRAQVLLARDPFGIKPLYVAQRPEGVYFASELKVLKAWLPDLTLAPAALWWYLHLGFIPSPWTLYEGVYKVQPGEVWTIQPKAVQRRFYYDRLSLWTQVPISPREAEDAVEATLAEAIRAHLVSDVPVGLFLSGGTDSSLVAALVRTLGQTLRAFAIGFRESAYNELPYAQAVAQALDLPFTGVILSQAEALPLLIRMGEWYDEPFGDVSAVPTYLVSQIASEQVEVVLAGDGGDELFGGYRRYVMAPWVGRGFMGGRVIEHMADWLPSAKARRALRLLGERADSPVLHLFAQDQNTFSAGELMRLLPEVQPPALPFMDRLPTEAPTRQAAWEFLYYLPDDLLTKVDRASMQHSLEVRVPLLDKRFVELAWRLPWALKRPGKHRPPQYKPLLRRLLAKYVPAPLVTRRKWGFTIPLAQWMEQGDLAEWAAEMGHPDRLAQRWGIPKEGISRLWQRFRKGQRELAARLWLLVQLGALK